MILQKIGIYGGTFDPIHLAHLILARDALEKFELEKIIFVPAAVSPDKEAPAAPAELRLQMLGAAIGSEPHFEIDDCELRRPPPSYTIDTIEELQSKYSGAKFFLLVGDDNLAGLPHWRRFADLRKLASLIILRRAHTAIAHEYLKVEREIDISATEIRDRIAAGRSIHYLVPTTVEKIIHAQGLYQKEAISSPNR